MSKSIVNGEQKVHHISLLIHVLFIHEQKYHLYSTHEQINHHYTSFHLKENIPKYINMGIIL